jgi:NAD(P)-dependent dehydrogenase (short-subunit alcohol dehydrogenase family)
MTAFVIDGHEEEVGASIPRGRIGSPEDAAGTAIYLCSRASAWITGETIVLDGGQVSCSG